MTRCEFKYIMIDNLPILFLVQDHLSMAIHGNITSAGFFRLYIEPCGDYCYKVEVYGKSYSLAKAGLPCTPKEDDGKIIEHFLGL